MQVFESSYPATFGFKGTGIESQGGVLAGVVQLGLTSRGNVGKLKPKQFIGDEHILGMQPGTGLEYLSMSTAQVSGPEQPLVSSRGILS